MSQKIRRRDLRNEKWASKKCVCCSFSQRSRIIVVSLSYAPFTVCLPKRRRSGLSEDKDRQPYNTGYVCYTKANEINTVNKMLKVLSVRENRLARERQKDNAILL